MNYSTAKTILRTYRREKSFLRKKTKIELKKEQHRVLNNLILANNLPNSQTGKQQNDKPVQLNNSNKLLCSFIKFTLQRSSTK